MRLADKLIAVFRAELFDLDPPMFEGIYQVKTLTNKLGVDIVFSCRFKTPQGITFILSIKICLIDKTPYSCISIHQLCQRRIFSELVCRERKPVSDEFHLRNLKKDKLHMQFYQNKRHFRYSIMGHIFVNNGMKDFLVKYVNQLEE